MIQQAELLCKTTFFASYSLPILQLLFLVSVIYTVVAINLGSLSIANQSIGYCLPSDGTPPVTLGDLQTSSYLFPGPHPITVSPYLGHYAWTPPYHCGLNFYALFFAIYFLHFWHYYFWQQEIISCAINFPVNVYQNIAHFFYHPLGKQVSQVKSILFSSLPLWLCETDNTNCTYRHFSQSAQSESSQIPDATYICHDNGSCSLVCIVCSYGVLWLQQSQSLNFSLQSQTQPSSFVTLLKRNKHITLKQVGKTLSPTCEFYLLQATHKQWLMHP